MWLSVVCILIDNDTGLWWPRTANRKIRISKEELFIFSFDLSILFYFSNLFMYLILNEIKEKVKSVEIQIKMK